MIWQTIDFKELPRLLAITALKDSDIMTLIEIMTVPLIELYDETLYKMQHNCQVIYMDKMLNEHFQIATYNPNSHIATRQIIIVDVATIAPTYIYQKEENKPVYLGTEYLDRVSVTSYQFIIKIPVGIPYNEIKLRALVDYYKLAGKQYIIETY